MQYWEIIADNLSKAGWSWGCVLAIDSNGRTMWITDAYRGDGKRFVVRAEETNCKETKIGASVSNWGAGFNTAAQEIRLLPQTEGVSILNKLR